MINNTSKSVQQPFINHGQNRQEETSSSNAHALKCSIVINNAGVQSLRIGNQDSAWQLFQAAINLISQQEQKGVKSSYRQIDNNIKELVIQLHRQKTSCNDSQRPSVPKTHSYPVTAESNFTKSSGFIYQHGLEIQPNSVIRVLHNSSKNKSNHYQSLCSMIISSIVIYNLGLIHHRAYLDENSAAEGHDNLLRVAVDMYGNADYLLQATIHRLVEVCGKSSFYNTLLDIQIIILNNMAVASYDLSHYGEARIFFQRLSVLIHYATERSNIDENSGEERDDSIAANGSDRDALRTKIGSKFIEQFFKNALYLKEPQIACAA